MEEPQPNPKPENTSPFWISRQEWEDHPQRVALKLGLTTAGILAVGKLAPLIALGAGLVIVGRLIRS